MELFKTNVTNILNRLNHLTCKDFLNRDYHFETSYDVHTFVVF